jgi:hypothetical protein
MMDEGYAPREGLRLAQHMGRNRFIIQSNNSLVVETMREGGYQQLLQQLSSAIATSCPHISQRLLMST